MYHPVLYIAVAIKNAGNPDTHNLLFSVFDIIVNYSHSVGDRPINIEHRWNNTASQKQCMRRAICLNATLSLPQTPQSTWTGARSNPVPLWWKGKYPTEPRKPYLRGRAMSRRLVAGLLLRWPGIDPGKKIHVWFLLTKATRGLVFLRVLTFGPVSIISPMLHTRI